VVQARAVDPLHGQEVRAQRLLDREKSYDVLMVEGEDGLRLVLEALETLGAGGQLRPQDLQRYLAVELRALGQEDHADAALANLAQ